MLTCSGNRGQPLARHVLLHTGLLPRLPRHLHKTCWGPMLCVLFKSGTLTISCVFFPTPVPSLSIPFPPFLLDNLQLGPVRGISIKLQEDERERRDNFVPDVSQLVPGDEGIQVDAETKEMLKEMDFGSIGTIASARPAYNSRR